MPGFHGFAFATMILAGAGLAPITPPAGDVTLFTVPAHVYKVKDPGRARTESWVFNLVVRDARGRADLRPADARLELYSGARLIETISLPESTLALKRGTSYRITADMDTIAYQRRFTTDETFDLRFAFFARPAVFAIDRVRVTLTLALPGAANLVQSLDVPVGTFAQKTALRFPLRGPAMVSQGPFNDFGHAGHSNQFALDLLGLNAGYGPWVPDAKGNEAYVGWGREVLAPAAGRVVYARNDVPDNTGEGDPLDTYRKLPDPMSAIVGNCVVIDHGDGEWSALMHMQQGSVSVHVGDRVTQGQPIGRLGNSGDAFGPHLHFQLQDGPELLWAASLPVKFDDLPGADLTKGSFLTPK